jgi:pimeloyl-ACP methyl ester carboxylesterase
VTRADSPLDHVTPYDRLSWSDIQVEHLLVTGEHARELTGYFGADECQYLLKLARQAHSVPLAPDAPRVYIVPGIMGSQLGRARRAPLPNDVLWLDPMDISAGQLSLLKFPDQASVISLGIVLYTYLRLKLHLRAAGFAPVCHDYDWRRGVDDLGQELAMRLNADPAPRVMLVAHSLGGLVSRAALAVPGVRKIERIVLMGTPNYGSFAPVQALRGVYAVVRKIARLAQSQTAEVLSTEVFNTFPSLYHLLPTARINHGLDFFDPASWPQTGPRVDIGLLAKARALTAVLAAPDARFTVIVGTGQETVTRVTRRKDDFVYTITRHGDGTVPLICAELEGARTYYTRVAHSELTRDRVVAQAVADLLRKGSTRRLETKCSRGGKAQARVSDSQLRRTHVDKVAWADLEPEARRVFLQTLNEPPQLQLRVPAQARRRR